jgi:serine/threonine protein kinase
MTQHQSRVDRLFVRFIDALVVEGRRLDPRVLCENDHEILAALLARIAKYEQIDGLLTKRKRLYAGRRLGDYEIEDEIGRGSMGIVYRARHETRGLVALKLFPPEREEDAESVARFEREARLIRKLDHPNVVKLHSIEEIDGLRFFTMDHVAGETLLAALPAQGFSSPVVLAIATPLANALACVHREGIVHRDLKLSNLMWTPDRELRILDFGVARLLADSTESLTRTGGVTGTICCMSPEQLTGERVDARSDLFSFGAVLYQLATGRSPFAGETLAEVIHAVLDRDPEPLSGSLGGLGSVIDECLRKDAAARPRDAAQVEAMLRALPATPSRG